MRSPTEWRVYIDWHTKYVGIILRVSRVLYSGKTKYQEVDIVESPDLGKCLIIDGAIQSSTFDEYIYHEVLVHPAMLTAEERKNILIIGGGEGATIREVLKYDIDKVYVIDIDEELVELCKEHLREMHQGAFEDKRVRLLFTDGMKFINESENRFDVIILDITDPTENTSSALYTREFYSSVKSRLSNNGVLVTQATSPNFSIDCFTIIHNTLEQVFKYVRAYTAPLRTYGGLWGFVIATDYRDPLTISNFSPLEGKDLAFYSKDIHLALFALNKRVNTLLANENRVATTDNTLYMPVYKEG